MADARDLPPAIDTLRAWLRLAFTRGLGPRGTYQLLQALGAPERIFATSSDYLSQQMGASRARALVEGDPLRDRAVDDCLAWARADSRPGEAGRHILTLDDPRYPQRLLALADPPLVLFVDGQLDALNPPALALVGSRHATRSGAARARAFAAELADRGWTIASGLALGIDAAAHLGALDTADGRTIAVVGNGLEQVYPTRHADLAEQIRMRGAIVSEHPIGTPPLRENFPRRNRLIAALAEGVLVVEAARRSGSLITARLAAEIGREVFAIPGSIDAPLAKGCHALIKQGAKLVDSVADIVEELAPGALPTAHRLSIGPPHAHSTPASSTGSHFPAVVDTFMTTPQADDGQSTGAALPVPTFTHRSPTVATSRQRALRTADARFDGSPALADGDDDPDLLLGQLDWDPVSIEQLGDLGPLAPARLAAALLRLEMDGRIERLTDGRYRRLAV